MLERLRRRGVLLHENGLWDGEQTAAGFDDWCEAHAGQACTLNVSSALLFELVAEPGLPLADDAAALQWARGVLLHYHGEPSTAWPLAPWHQHRVHGVSALHGLQLEALVQSAGRSRVRLTAVRPWWACVLPRALQRHPPLRRGSARVLVVEGTILAAVDLDRGQVQRVAQHRLDEPVGACLLPWVQGAAAAEVAVVGYGLAGAPPHGAAALSELGAPFPAPAWLH